MTTSKPDWPSDKKSVPNKQCHTGKKVTINTIGGALLNVKGVIVEGPYQWTIKGCKQSKDKNGKDKMIKAEWETVPYWLAKVDYNGLYLKLTEEEFKRIPPKS